MQKDRVKIWAYGARVRELWAGLLYMDSEREWRGKKEKENRKEIYLEVDVMPEWDVGETAGLG